MKRDAVNGGARQPRDFEGRFYGVQANVEDVPRLPSSAARLVLEDPRAVPYLAAWTSYHHGEGVAVDLVAELRRIGPDAIDVQAGRLGCAVRVVRHRRFPGRHELAWGCRGCGRGTRFVYFYRVSAWGIVPAVAGCARCRGLRWSSQGRPIGPLARAFRGGAARAPLPRLPWEPVAVGTRAALEERFPGLMPLIEVGVTGEPVRHPTARTLEWVEKRVGRISANLARLEARFRG